jgi:ATP-binding cassette subfamily B protein
MFSSSFPFVKQNDSTDCGLACLAMVAAYFGKKISISELAKNTTLTKNGLYAQDISRVAEQIGFRTLLIKTDLDNLAGKLNGPCILHWNKDHFITLYKIGKEEVHYADPAFGILKVSFEEFKKAWYDIEGLGFAILLDVTPQFYKADTANVGDVINKARAGYIFKYLAKYKLHLTLLLLSLLIGSVLQLMLPFFTQWIIDDGISFLDTDFVYLTVGALFAIYLTSTIIDFLRSRLLIHLSSRVNIFIISDFLIKLMNLPLVFFDGRFKGDLIQRVRDHDRIERFLTDTLLKSIFSVFSVIIFSCALAYYNFNIFLIFLACTGFEIGWIFVYLGKMRINDNKIFQLMSQDQSKLFEIINGIQEIKLNNIEKKIRWEWERIQAAIFKENVEKLDLSQKQNGGAKFFSYFLIVCVNLIGAIAVIHGSMTLGSLIAVLFILSQLNTPISQILTLILQGYTAKFSLERMGEIYNKEDESQNCNYSAIAETGQGIAMKNVSFSFNNDANYCTLKNISLNIPPNKITAIVGMSGSGKTTLIKLLLKFYEPLQGEILIGDQSLSEINPVSWRDKCGSVLQDSFIFSDTIGGNIALDEFLDYNKLRSAAQMANIHVFIDSLPNKYQTKIGENGLSLSQGQKQRILIARAIYKQPQVLFFDEATNALDANNEKVITENLKPFFKGRTVVISAHRLSTIKNADQIILIDNGRIIEIGNHDDLLANKNKYYNLVENQLTI